MQEMRKHSTEQETADADYKRLVNQAVARIRSARGQLSDEQIEQLMVERNGGAGVTLAVAHELLVEARELVRRDDLVASLAARMAAETGAPLGAAGWTQRLVDAGEAEELAHELVMRAQHALDRQRKFTPTMRGK